MFKVTTGLDSASVLFNLPGYRVLDAVVDEAGRRRVRIATMVSEAACPSCGVLTSRVHQVSSQRVADVPFGGLVEVVWVKRRWRCAERACRRLTFSEHTDQVPPRARVTSRLKDAVVAAVTVEARAIDRVAGAFGVSWPSVQRQVSAAMARLAAARAVRPRLVAQLGIDEHRFRSVRWFRDDTGAWKRVEPWSITFTDLATGTVLGVVDGRDSAAVKRWLNSQPRWWRHRVRVVAIDPSAAFRAAVGSLLPTAKVSVDHFHLVKLANDMVTAVRRRVSWDLRDRRGRAVDPAWAHRLLLLRGYDTLSQRGRAKLTRILAVDDPTNEIGAAWGVKEQLRLLLRSTTLAGARAARARFNTYVTWAAMAETTKLKNTIDAWWGQIEVFISTRVTNARSEAVNLNSKQIKRNARGFRNHDHYRARIMLTSAARTAA